MPNINDAHREIVVGHENMAFPVPLKIQLETLLTSQGKGDLMGLVIHRV